MCVCVCVCVIWQRIYKTKVKKHLHFIGVITFLDQSSRSGRTWAIYISGAVVNKIHSCFNCFDIMTRAMRVPQLVNKTKRFSMQLKVSSIVPCIALLDTQHNDNQHNNTQHNVLFATLSLNATRHNDIQHNGLICNNQH